MRKLLQKSISSNRLQGVTTVAARYIRTKFNCTMFESMSANMHVMILRWLYSNCVLLQSFRAYVQLREGVVMGGGSSGGLNKWPSPLSHHGSDD